MYTFTQKSTGYHHGQTDMTLSIFEKDTLLGTCEYSIYDNVPYINMISVKPEYRNKGIGKQLIYKLLEDYKYEDIQWGMMTEDGYRLQKSLDKEFHIDRENLENKNLPKDILNELKKRNKILYEFALDLYTYGNDAWNMWIELQEQYTKDNYKEMKEVNDIVEWIDGSILNDHDTKESPPTYIFDILKKLKIFKKEYIKEKSIVYNNYIKKEEIMNNSKKIFLKEGQKIIDSNENVFEVEKGDYVLQESESTFSNNKRYADKYFAKEIRDLIKKNKDSQYPLSIQLRGEYDNTHWLGLSIYDLEVWLDALDL